MASEVRETAANLEGSVVGYGKRRGRPAAAEGDTGSPVREDGLDPDPGRDGCVRVKGEHFRIKVEPGEEGDTVYLVHPRWSVLGSGRTLEEAERDLREEAREVGELLADEDPAGFSRGGRQMREFVLRFVSASP